MAKHQDEETARQFGVPLVMSGYRRLTSEPAETHQGVGALSLTPKPVAIMAELKDMKT